MPAMDLGGRDAGIDGALRRVRDEAYCYLTTTGRRSGRPHEIEIWFALAGRTVYLLSGGRDASDWVRNLLATPAVTVRIAGDRFPGAARVVEAPHEDALARGLLVEKYAPGYDGDLTEWRDTALPIAVDLDPQTPQAPSTSPRS
jgi:deazaflavin-dependent oxidoreductase (nitroreductase family)